MIHAKAKSESLLKFFQERKKMRNADLNIKYEEEIENEIDKLIVSYRKANEAKLLLKSNQTPIVLITFMLLSYFASCFFNALWLQSVSFVSKILFYFSVSIFVLWCFTKLNKQSIATLILFDVTCDYIWTNVSLKVICINSN